MNSLSPIFEQLKRENITLRVVGDNLVIHPKKLASQGLVLKIRESKAEIIMLYEKKKSILKNIIYEVGRLAGESENGCEETFNETIKQHSIHVAIATFKALKEQVGCVAK